MAHLLHHAEKDNVPFSRPHSPSTPSEKHRPAFVGLGAMGYPMARNLASSSRLGPRPLLVWNRTTSKSEALLKELGPTKIEIAKDLAQIARESDIILTNVANDAVAKSVYEEFAKALANIPTAKSKVFVETSTIFPAAACELEAIINQISHARFITCPVFGAPAAADKAQLLLVMSGDYISKKEVAYLLCPAIGRKVFDLGGNIEKAPILKLIGNSMILGSIEIMAEAFTLAEKTGVGADRAYDIVKDLFQSPVMTNYGDKMIHDKFDGSAGFNIDGGIKDAQHIRRLTSEHNSPMPIIDVAHQHLISARALHVSGKQAGNHAYDVLDWSGVIAASRAAAGLDGFDTNKHVQLVREANKKK